MQELSLFSTPSLTFIVCRLFDEGHFDQCEVISPCSFDLHFSNNEQHSENKDHGIQSHHFMANRWGNMETVTDFILEAPKSLQMVTAAMKLKDAYSLEENL